VPACNKKFFNVAGGQAQGAHEFPLEFDALVPSYARREFRDKLPECFSFGIAQEIERAYYPRDGTHCWPLSLKRSGIPKAATRYSRSSLLPRHYAKNGTDPSAADQHVPLSIGR